MLMKNSAKFDIDLNAKDLYGNTALNGACWSGNISMVKMLIKNSSEFNIEMTNDGKTVFHMAGMHGQLELAEMLMKSFAATAATACKKPQ